MIVNKTQVFYFHGAPGSASEGIIFEKHAVQHNLEIINHNRFSIEVSTDKQSYYQQIAKQVIDIADSKPINIVGFSIGAHVALEVSAILASQVNQLHLISSAAPLTAGDFLDGMAGGPVFKLARDKPAIFSLLTGFQKLLAKFSPNLLTTMLFASAMGEDKRLSKTDNFREYVTPLLRDCFKNSTAGYKRDIHNYVNWQGDINIAATNTYLWHGSDDNWSPFSMAAYLQTAIPGKVSIKSLDGLSHYSTLFHAAPLICEKIALDS